MSVFVICAHVFPLSSYTASGNYLLSEIISRIAVPYFFTAAGFLLFSKIPDIGAGNSKTVLAYISRILRLYGTWMLLLFFCDTGHLWFLGSLAVAVGLAAALREARVGHIVIASLALILFFFGSAFITYPALFEHISLLRLSGRILGYMSSAVRNGLVFGFPYVTLGMLFADRSLRIGKKASVLGSVFFFALLLSEGIYAARLGGALDNTMFFSLIPLTAFLFALSLNINPAPSPVYRHMRVCSMMIYYVHMAAFYLVCKLLPSLSNSMLVFLLVLVSSALFALLVENLSQKEKLAFLTLLYR